MKHLTFWCLAFAGLGSIAGSFDLAFGEIVRLLLITGGMTWLLWKRPPILDHLSKLHPHQGLILLTSLAYLFVLSRFPHVDDGNTGLFVLSGSFVGIAFLGTLFSGPSPLSLSRFEKIVLIGGGIGILASLSTQFVFVDQAPRPGFSRWVGPIRIAVMAIACLSISRFLRKEHARDLGFRLLTVVAITYGVISAVGLWRVGVAYYHYHQLIQSFRSGQHEEVGYYASRLATGDPHLHLPWVSIEGALSSMAEATTVSSTGNSSANAVIGDLADRYHLWGVAADTYSHIAHQDPDFPAIHTKIANCLFEQGMCAEALDLYHKDLEQPARANAETCLALGIALARTGSGEEANRYLLQAIRLSGLEQRFQELFPLGQSISSGRIDQLVPQDLEPYLGKLTLFRITQLLEAQGWKVLHPGMQIGSTGLTTPVDIVAQSGGGSTFLQEHIWVDGKDVSLHKRGYNVAVIDPHTGFVETTGNFDTWLLTREGNRLAGFLRGIPKGRIVVATISDEASSELSGAAKAAFTEEIGVSQLPRAWWSHAFIGVKGSARASASEAISSPNTLVNVGVLKANVSDAVAENHPELEAALREAAATAPGGIAIFVPSLDPSATILVARR